VHVFGNFVLVLRAYSELGGWVDCCFYLFATWIEHEFELSTPLMSALEVKSDAAGAIADHPIPLSAASASPPSVSPGGLGASPPSSAGEEKKAAPQPLSILSILGVRTLVVGANSTEEYRCLVQAWSPLHSPTCADAIPTFPLWISFAKLNAQARLLVDNFKAKEILTETEKKLVDEYLRTHEHPVATVDLAEYPEVRYHLDKSIPHKHAHHAPEPLSKSRFYPRRGRERERSPGDRPRGKGRDRSRSPDRRSEKKTKRNAAREEGEISDDDYVEEAEEGDPEEDSEVEVIPEPSRRNRWQVVQADTNHSFSTVDTSAAPSRNFFEAPPPRRTTRTVKFEKSYF